MVISPSLPSFGLHALARGRLTHYRVLFDKADITSPIQAIAGHGQHEQQSGYNANAIVAARQMLDLAERFLMDGTVALAPQALSTTRAYLQTLEQG